MKSCTSRFFYQDFLRIILVIFMLSTIINLFGDIPIINPCPVDFDGNVTPLDGTFTVGSRFLFTYTISFIPDKVTKFDKQRTYSLSSEFFSNDKNYGSLRTVSSDIQNGDTFTYSQFPVTGHLTVMLYGRTYGCIDSPFINLYMTGYAVKGCPDTSLLEGDKYIQQSSSFSMGIPSGDDNKDDEY